MFCSVAYMNIRRYCERLSLRFDCLHCMCLTYEVCTFLTRLP